MRKLIIKVVASALILAAGAFPVFAEKVKLTQMVSQDWTTEADEELAKQFTKETGVEIEWQVNPSAQHHDLLKVKLIAGEGPDIFWIQSNKWTVKTDIDAPKNCIDMSQEKWVKTMTPAKVESVSYGGKVYGQGYFVKGVSFPIIYNKTLFKELGLKVPKTYADFKKVCDAIMGKGIVPLYECVPAGWHHVLWIMQIGDRYSELQPGIVEKLNANKAKLADVKGLQTAVEQLQEMVKNGYFGKDFMDNSYDNWASQLASRKAAMFVQKSGEINTIAKNYPDCKDEFGVFLIPLVDAQTAQADPNGPARFGYALSKHQKEIKMYFDFLARKENIQYKLDHTPSWSAIDCADSVGVEQHYLPAEKELFASIPKSRGTGIIWQDSVSYVNDQWMDVGKDLSAMFIGTMTPKQVIAAMDERRDKTAKAAGDPAWK